MSSGQSSVTFQTLIVALLVGGLAMAGVNMWLGGFSGGYGNTFSENTTIADMNLYDDINETVGDVGDVVTAEEEGGLIDRTIGAIDAVFSSGFTALRLLLNVPKHYYTSLSVSLEAIGLPPGVVGVVLSFLVTIIIAIALLLIIQAVTRIR